MDLKVAQTRGNNALKRLRTLKLASGLPFMINSKDLPSTQCYLEYPDSRIILVSIKTQEDRDFKIIRELSGQEKKGVRAKFNL